MTATNETVCTSCFIECERGERKQASCRAFPCSDDLRAWAKRHRYDKGDERGYVDSDKCGDDK